MCLPPQTNIEKVNTKILRIFVNCLNYSNITFQTTVRLELLRQFQFYLMTSLEALYTSFRGFAVLALLCLLAYLPLVGTFAATTSPFHYFNSVESWKGMERLSRVRQCYADFIIFGQTKRIDSPIVRRIDVGRHFINQLELHRQFINDYK
jgi:hypothetical protein